MNPEVSVIVPVYNSESTLERCLRALSLQRFAKFELIVVDNGSTYDSLEIIKSWREKFPVELSLVHEKKTGAAAARNRGADVAKGEWLAFIDSDCEADENWLSSGWRLVKSRNPDAMAGPAWGTMEGDSSAKLMGLTTLSTGMDEQWIDNPGPSGMRGFAAANLWVCKRVFNSLGGFDVAITGAGEDIDFCNRLYRNNKKIFYSPELKVRHIHQSGMVNMFRKMVFYGRAHAVLLGKYGKRGLQTDLSQHVWPLGPLSISIVLRSADKKLIYLLLAGVVWFPFFLVVPIYVLYLARFLKRRAADIGYDAGWIESFWMGCLLIVKSAGMTLGRIMGSRKFVWTC